MHQEPVCDPGALRPSPAANAAPDAADDPSAISSTIPGDRGRPVWRSDARLAGFIPSAGLENRDSWTVPGGRQRAPGSWAADGGTVGPVGEREPAGGPGFDCPVPVNGYTWWYLDALSDDGLQGLTLIVFVGSVFSPYYARARRRAATPAEQHNAFNVVLHGNGRGRWCMTERSQAQLWRTADALQIGRSSVAARGDALEFQIVERGCPLPLAMRGSVRFEALQRTGHREALDPAGRHWWTPLAPMGRVEVRMREPAVSWSGNAYLDSNQGSEPLEQAFRNWHWSRAATRSGSVVLYDVTRRDGDELRLALRFNTAGGIESLTGLEPAALPSTRWQIARATRSDAGHPARLLRTLVDAPFYGRSVIRSTVAGESVTAIHESLSLARFDSRWVQALLPFRMPRQWWK
jgi:carotenoid 1,2-hydratase